MVRRRPTTRTTWIRIQGLYLELLLMSKNFLVDVSCWLRYLKPLVPRFSGREVGPVVTSYIELGMSYGIKALLYLSISYV